MPEIRWLRFTVLLLLSATVAALMLSTALGKKPPAPPPPPCDGCPVEVVNDDWCGLSKTILVNDSTAACNILCLYLKTKKDKWQCPVQPIAWIGGIVIADAGAEHGFDFDPNTVIVAEITAEGMQTNTCQIAANPGFYDGGRWYIPANFAGVTVQ